MAVVPRDLLIFLYIRHNHNWDKIYNDILNHTIYSDDEVSHTLLDIDKDLYITIFDEDYPKYLKRYPKPAFVLDLKHPIDTQVFNAANKCDACRKKHEQLFDKLTKIQDDVAKAEAKIKYADTNFVKLYNKYLSSGEYKDE